MLNILRKNASSWIVKIILFLIVIVFVFLGIGSEDSRKANRAALVNDQEISLDDYHRSYNNLIEQYRRQFGNAFNDQMIEMFQLRRQALEQLINKTVLLQEAEKLNFRVSDEELAEYIANMDVFKENGVFSEARYKQVLSSNRLAAPQFELMQKEAMLIDKLQSFVVDNVQVSDREAKDWYQWNETSVKIKYVNFNPESHSGLRPSAEELEKYFSDNGSKYMTTPKIKVRYAKFLPENYSDRVSVTDGDVSLYYEDKIDQYEQEKTVEARHILIKVDENAADDVVEGTRKRAEGVLAKINTGGDFAELAKKFSEGPTKTTGGYLGEFKATDMVKPFADKAFSMEAGRVSEPVRTRFGWHIIKVEKVNEAHTKELKDVAADIKKKLIAEKTANLAYDDAEAIFELVDSGEDFKQAADERNVKIYESEFFDSKGPETGIDDKAKFAEAAFNLMDDEISDILEFEKGFYLVDVIEKREAKIPALEDVKARVTADLIDTMKDNKAKEQADAFHASIISDNSLEGALKEFGVSVQETESFKRNDYIPGIGNRKEILDAAFSLTGDKKYSESVFKGAQGYYVLMFSDKMLPKEEDFDKEKENVVKKLLQEKQRKSFDNWLSKLRSGSDIRIEQGILN